MLFGQIGKAYRNVNVKGPIVQMQSIQTMIVEKEDGRTMERVMDRVTAQVDAGRVMKIEHSSGVRSADYKMFTEFDWKGDQLQRVRNYSQMGSSRQLDRQNVAMYGPEGRIASENILFGKDELRATLSYTYSESPEGNEILEMTMYKPDALESQGQFYIESDQWGQVLHIESVGKDTGLYIQRLENIGDSLFIGIKIMSSRRARGQRDTIWTTTLNRYDTHGNVTYSETNNKRRNPEGEGMLEMRLITETDYFYEGDNVPELKAGADDFLGQWSCSVYNFTLSIGGKPGALQGIYTTGTIRDDDPQVVEVGSDWVFRLRDSFTGNWEYDPATQIMTFKQNEHVVATAKASLRFFELRLQSTEEQETTAIFSKS